MALKPIDYTHALQIQAGTLGKKAGHQFEDEIATRINSIEYPFVPPVFPLGHVFSGCPTIPLLSYIASHARFDFIPKPQQSPLEHWRLQKKDWTG